MNEKFIQSYQMFTDVLNDYIEEMSRDHFVVPISETTERIIRETKLTDLNDSDFDKLVDFYDECFESDLDLDCDQVLFIVNEHYKNIDDFVIELRSKSFSELRFIFEVDF